MIDGRSSQTAAFVAAWRALGDTLPKEVRLCHDPFGWTFSPPAIAGLRPIAERYPAATGRVLLASPLGRLLLWMQLRTRAIDDIAIAFARDGGRQIVVLGAGFDARALRLASRLEGARVFEVDHPATQARKRALLETTGVRSAAEYVAWDFERDPLEEFPAKLTARGLDPGRSCLTIWEGVIPYLTERAVDETLRAVRTFGSDASRVILHYIERGRIESRTVWHVAAARVGEPLRFGWEPSALAGWLSARGLQLLSDRTDEELARELFTSPWIDTVRGFRGAGGRIAVAGVSRAAVL